ncbi:MAG: hypothetical protein WC447_02825 [Candidatus Paceibacterota bacterium]
MKKTRKSKRKRNSLEKDIDAIISFLEKEKIKRLIIRREMDKARMAFLKVAEKLTTPDFRELDKLISRIGRCSMTRISNPPRCSNRYSRRSGHGAR